MNLDEYRDKSDLGEVQLNGKRYGFPGYIGQVLYHDRRVYIVLDKFRDRTSDDDLFSNVFAFDLGSGNLLWRIEPCPQKMNGYPLHYANLLTHYGRLYVRSYYDSYHEVDTETGKVKFVGQSLPEE